MTIDATSYALLEARRTAIIARINAWSEGDVGDKADTTQPGAARHVAYKDGLYRELMQINQLLSAYDNEINGGGEVLSEGRT